MAERFRDRHRDALIKRINRVLKAKGQKLRVSRFDGYGYYLERLTDGPPIPWDGKLDILALGKELGVADTNTPEDDFDFDDGVPPTEADLARIKANSEQDVSIEDVLGKGKPTFNLMRCQCDCFWCNGPHGVTDSCYELPDGVWTNRGVQRALCNGCYLGCDYADGPIPASEWRILTEDEAKAQAENTKNHATPD